MQTRPVLLVFVCALVGALACGSGKLRKAPEATGAGGAGAGSGGRAAAGVGGSGGGFALPDAAASDGGACKPIGCTLAGGRYCGRIGDGCGGVLECGNSCGEGESCGGAGTPNVCGKPVDPTCKPSACEQPGGRLCGRVGDGCGRALECSECPMGASCGAVTPNVCGAGGRSACGNLCNQQVACVGGGTTRVSGVVVTPAPSTSGIVDPIYNAVVYVPNAAVKPFAPGVACDRCGAEISGEPIVTALTGPDGRFTLENVPAGKDIPLVIQIGRWRRQVKIPEVLPCQSTQVPVELTRLPRNQSEGDIPLMAIATGKWDPLECLLRKIGIDDSEFTLPSGKGRVHLYVNSGLTLGPDTPKGSTLTSSLPTLERYDAVLLPCDTLDPKPRAEQKAIYDYATKGGRVFMTDWSWSWLQDGGPLQSAAPFNDYLPEKGSKFGVLVDQSFPKGKAMAAWLQEVKAAGAAGQVPVDDVGGGISWYRELNPPTQRWVYADPPPSSEIFSFNTPVGAEAKDQCGRVVYSGFHIADHPEGPAFPKDCVPGPMTPQEKILEFMLFDVAACVQPDKDPPSVFRPPVPAPPPPPPMVQ